MIDKIMEWSENEEQPEGLPVETLKKLSDYCKENYNCALPQGYLDFLEKMNGFCFDGYSVFGCYNDETEKKFPRRSSLDLINFNNKFVAFTDIQDYIMLGKSCLDYIGYIKDTKRYVVMTNGTMDHLNEFETFDELLMYFFNIT